MFFTILINRLRGGKNFRLPYFIAQAARYMTPKWLLRRRLSRVFSDGERRYDMTYILDRVNYYNQTDGSQPLSDDTTPLRAHKFRGHRSAYIFDSYQTTRWFPDHLRWSYFFGDGVFHLAHPTIIKVRPVGPTGQNSVLLDLDRCRYNILLKDTIPFAQKQDKAIFRGSVKSSRQRQLFIEKWSSNPRVDTADTFSGHSHEEKGTARQISLYAHLDFKYILSLEGNDIASNTRWIMSTNSIAVMPRPCRESWFMEGRLIPDYHYIEVKPDFSDLLEKMDYYTAHPDAAQAIIDHANDYVRQFQDSRRERLISLLVMKKYFENTGQLPQDRP